MISPAVEAYTADIARTAGAKKAVSADISCKYETELVKKLSLLLDEICEKTDVLEAALMDLDKAKDTIEESEMIRDMILPKMCELRVPCDEAEVLTAKRCWPFPTYADLLFGTK